MLDLTDVPVVDHHCHSIVRGHATLDLPGWLGHFTEAAAPAMRHRHAATTLAFRRTLRLLAAERIKLLSTRSPWWCGAIVVALLLATALSMVFGELVPKNLAIARPEPVARALATSTSLYLAAFGWVIRIFDAASNALLRALRIEPSNPLLWIELGRIRQAEGNYAQADAMGRRALSLASGDPQTQAAAWNLIAESLRARRRNQEAAEAEQRAKDLLGG